MTSRLDPTKKVGLNFSERVLEVFKKFEMCNRETVFKELDAQGYEKTKISGSKISQHPTYKRIHYAFKVLKKHEIISVLSDGWWILGLGGGATQLFGKKIGTAKNEVAERFLSKPALYQNIRVKLIGANGIINFKEKLDPRIYTNAWIKIQKTSLLSKNAQIYFKCKRPGYSHYQLLSAFGRLRDILREEGLVGTLIIESFEIRNEKNLIVRHLKDFVNPFYFDIAVGIMGKVYHDRDNKKSHWELLYTNQEMEPAEFFNLINNINTTAKIATISQTIENKFNAILTRMDLFVKQLHKTHSDTLAMNFQSTNAIETLRNETEDVIDQMHNLGQRSTEISGVVQQIYAGLDEIEMVGSSVSPTSNQNFEKIKNVIDRQTEILGNQTEILRGIAADTKDINIEVKTIKQENRVWMELTDQARIETLEEYAKLNYSWQKVADFFEIAKGTAYKWVKRNAPHIIDLMKKDYSNDGNGGVDPTKETTELDNIEHMKEDFGVSIGEQKSNFDLGFLSVNIKEDIIKDIILEFVKVNPGCSKNAICNHLRTGSKQSRLELINSMVRNNLLEEKDHPSYQRRKLYFINNIQEEK